MRAILRIVPAPIVLAVLSVFVGWVGLQPAQAGSSAGVTVSPNQAPAIDSDKPSVSAGDVWTVGGTGGQALVLHCNGMAWSIVPSPSPGQSLDDIILYGVSAAGPDNV